MSGSVALMADAGASIVVLAGGAAMTWLEWTWVEWTWVDPAINKK